MTVTVTVTRNTWAGGPVRGVDAPGSFLPAHRHWHLVPGVWDDDNGSAAGRLCRACWEAGRACSAAAVTAAATSR